MTVNEINNTNYSNLCCTKQFYVCMAQVKNKQEINVYSKFHTISLDSRIQNNT